MFAVYERFNQLDVNALPTVPMNRTNCTTCRLRRCDRN